MNKRSFFPSLRASSLAGLAIAGLMISSLGAIAQVTGSSQTTTDANGKQQQTVTLSASPSKKGEKVVQSKDTKKELQKEKKIQPVLSETLPWEGVAEAHQKMYTNSHAGKIAILVQAERAGLGAAG